LFMSGMMPEKGFAELSDAYMSLPADARNRLRLDLAGMFDSESKENDFRARIAGGGDIHYHGAVSGDTKKKLFADAHVFCLPTAFFEGQPISILEAYAAGCVVLASCPPGILDIFEPGVNGFEVEPRSVVSIRNALLKLAETPGDLLKIALTNRETADVRFREKSYRAAMVRIVTAPHSIAGHMNKEQHRVCSNCVMDTTAPGIAFDEQGWCDYCRNYHDNILPVWRPGEGSEEKLAPLLERIRTEGAGRPHDCLIGLSGGVDSSYVAYLAKEKYGLRPLLLHVDAGWNSQISTSNIERLVDKLGLDLHTEVINWLEMRDLQLAFFKAQVPHVDTPQDHAFFASLYNFAAANGFKYILTGANYSTECVREPLEWHYHASDLRQLRDIHRRFGARPLETFPTADIFKYKLYYRFVKGIRVVKPLDSIPYHKEDAMRELEERFGWQRYAHKHYESRFTRFYEGYWLPKKFGYDKRRAHFSSLILTGQMTRAEALARLSRPPYDEREMEQDFEFVATKLGLTVEELRGIMKGENRTYRDYDSNMPLISLATNVLRLAGVQKTIIR
ncbi:MAG TPA: N-acetyl sugar amidotransferase, partial [Elusimicrobiales bacterium]|nr:N-acetyl sugar amidotransferase [Elusimicrobiales bacterium]